MNSNFRNTEDRREIIRIFGQMNPANNILWQNLHGRRFVYTIEAISIDPSLNRVQFKTSEKLNTVHERSYVYVKLSNRESFCKLKYLNHGTRVLSCQIPTDIKTLELRNCPRFRVRPENPIFATVLIGSDLLSSAKKAIKLQISDLSTNGIALNMPEKDFISLKDSLFVEISHLNNIKLEHSLIIHIVHDSESRYLHGHKHKNGYKIGFKLSKPLEQHFIDQVILSIPG